MLHLRSKLDQAILRLPPLPDPDGVEAQGETMNRRGRGGVTLVTVRKVHAAMQAAGLIPLMKLPPRAVLHWDRGSGYLVVMLP